jgi:hypothetical protein
MKPFSADPRYSNTKWIAGALFKMGIRGLMFVNKSQSTSRPHSKNENRS